MKKQIFAVSVIFCAMLVPLFGQSAPTNSKQWNATGALGFTLAKGNSDTLLLTTNFLASKKWTRDEIDIGADGAYGEASGVQNFGNLHFFGQYNRLFSKKLFALFRADVLHDALSDLNYRATLSPGMGIYFIKNTKSLFRLEGGPAFVFEKQAGIRDEYFSIRVAERFETFFTKNIKLWQSLEYLPDSRDLSNFILNAEIGIDVKLTQKISLRTFFQDTYNSNPYLGLEKNDLKLVAAIAYKF